MAGPLCFRVATYWRLGARCPIGRARTLAACARVVVACGWNVPSGKPFRYPAATVACTPPVAQPPICALSLKVSAAVPVRSRPGITLFDRFQLSGADDVVPLAVES